MRNAEDVAREILRCAAPDGNFGSFDNAAEVFAAALRAYAAEAVGEAVVRSTSSVCRPNCFHLGCSVRVTVGTQLEALRREIEGGTDA